MRGSSKRPFTVFVSLWLSTCLALSARCAEAVTYSVGGSETACTHHSLQDAIDEIPDGSTGNVVQVANSASYTQLALEVDGKDVQIIGGYTHCGDAQPSGHTVLDGASNGGHSVVRFADQTTATLENFEIRNGHQGSDSHGGGVNFIGHGSLTLRNDTIHGNSCGYGAGVNVTSDGTATLTLATGMQVFANTADHEGGGVRIEHDTHLVVSDGTVIIALNTAGDDGAGLAVLSPAQATIGSVGNGALPLFSGNSTPGSGGAIFAGGDSAVVQLYTRDANNPLYLHGNEADESGGAVSLWAGAVLCANDFQLDGNFAADGTAIYASADSAVYLNTNPDGRCLATPGSVPCTASTACNSISAGKAEDAEAEPTDGAAIAIHGGSTIRAERFQMRGNQGGYSVRVDNDDGEASVFHSCLMADNVVTGALVKTDDNSPVEFLDCTFAHNTIGGPYVFAIDDDFQLYNSIVSQPGTLTFHETDGDSLIIEEFVLASDISTLVSGPSIHALDDARFVDPAHGDYHLQAASPAVDGGANYTSETIDLDGLPRGVDLPLVPDTYAGGSPGDVGAYERQAVGNLVLDGDFGQDLRLWSLLTAGSASWDGTHDADGLTTSGSAHVDVPRSNTPVEALTQCIHLPGPSLYALDGAALAGGNISVGHDVPSLHWFLHRASDDCSGTPDAQGTLNIPAGSSSWHDALEPALIDATSGWTRTSTVEVRLVVTEGNISAGGDTAAWFDAIELVPTQDDTIFADGFDT